MSLSIWNLLKFFGSVVFNAFFLLEAGNIQKKTELDVRVSEPGPHHPTFSHTALEVPQQNTQAGLAHLLNCRVACSYKRPSCSIFIAVPVTKEFCVHFSCESLHEVEVEEPNPDAVSHGSCLCQVSAPPARASAVCPLTPQLYSRDSGCIVWGLGHLVLYAKFCLYVFSGMKEAHSFLSYLQLFWSRTFRPKDLGRSCLDCR